ncbi:unnamed protein product [Phytomonas sp. Hart1]|nr:unnamed protein product [Phytomonas sp. Hart1]|eukprot:CCW71988.1 unnamed protein product [Phytomonas sp. isolate Hart1]
MTSLTVLDYNSILIGVIAIAGLPTAWNIIARNEYRHHTIEKILKGKKRGAYLLATAIFIASLLRDFAFKAAVQDNPSLLMSMISAYFSADLTILQTLLQVLGILLLIIGNILVVSSFCRLGITGTYLGDYFGIKMKKRVTAFPFSHFESPMYLGSTLSFLGTAFLYRSEVGVLLAVWVGIVYYVATVYFESPFTAMIYSDNKKA